MSIILEGHRNLLIIFILKDCHKGFVVRQK